MRGPFVGREAELQSLNALLNRPLDRPGPAAGIIVGPPGSGKSRLLDEVLASTSRPILRVIGYEAEQGVPLTAARALLRELSQRGGRGRELREIAFGGQARGDGATPLRLFEATYRCLAEAGPLVLMVDDAQWLDDVSVALLSYLLRAGEADGKPMAVLVGGRPSATTGKLRDAVLAILPGKDLHAELELGPLSEGAGVAMVRGMKPEASVADAARIWQRAAGSPFWIEALTITGEAQGDSLADRFGQLGEDAVAVLQALALIARPSDLSELARLLDWPAQRVQPAMAELRGRGLAIERPGSIETAHDLIRETARRQVPVLTARRLESRLAAQLWRTADGDVRRLREALNHALAAEELGLEIAVDLAGAPQRRLIGASGVRELVRIAEAADPSDARRQALEHRLAELATELGDRTLELERWLAVADHDDRLTRAGALLAAAKAAYRMGNRDAAADLVERARRTNVDEEAIGIVLDALESEILRWLDHRLPEARRLTDRALEGAAAALHTSGGRQVIDRRLRSACLEALQAACDLALQEGNEVDQARFAEQIVELAEGELERMEARLLLASAYRRVGRIEEAEQIARRVREQAEQRLYPSVMVTASHHLANALYRQGRVDEAERVAYDAERLSARIGLTGRFLSEVRSLRPGITVSRGDWRAGIETLRADIEREHDPHYKLGIQQEIATWLARLAGRAEADEVRTQIAEARANLAAVGCPRCGRELALRSAEALARIGDLDAARLALRSQVGQRTRHSHEGRLFLSQAVGALLLASGRSIQAAAALRRLASRLTASGMHREAMWADLDQAAALSARKPDAAVRLYRSVAERARSWGVLTDLQVSQQRLRDLGARMAPPRQTPGPLGLSRRELQVAQMAASGASNPEIAETLFLSRKTVERHVSAALAKVGARNRTELASRLAALGPSAGQEMRDMPDTDLPPPV